MSKTNVKKDIESNAAINELKIKRNQGVLSDDVIKMCTDQLDDMINAATQHVKVHGHFMRDYSLMKSELSKNMQLLALVCQFADDYVEVIKWNKLIREIKLAGEMTIAHRESDIALFNKISDETYQLSIDAPVFNMLYNYGHATAGC